MHKFFATAVTLLIMVTSTPLRAEGEYTLMYRLPFKDSIEYREFKTRESCKLAAAMLKGMFTQQLMAGGHKDKQRIKKIVNSRIHCIPS